MAKSKGWYGCYDCKECVPRSWSGAQEWKKGHLKCEVLGKRKLLDRNLQYGVNLYGYHIVPAVERLQRKKALRLIDQGWTVPLSDFELMVYRMAM